MLKTIKGFLIKYYDKILGLLLLPYCRLSHGDLPPAPSNSNFSSGNYIAGMNDIALQVISVSLLVVVALTIIGYIYALASTFVEAKKQREWGHFSLVAVIGAALVVVVLIIANVANTHFAPST